MMLGYGLLWTLSLWSWSRVEGYVWQDAGLGVCRINGDDGQGYGCWTWCDGQTACEDDDTCVAYWNHGNDYQCFCTDTTGMCTSCSGTITTGTDLAGSGTQNLDTCWIKGESEPPVEPPAESPVEPGQGYVWQDAGLGVCRINGDDGQGYGCWTWCDGQQACEDDDTCVAYWNHGNDYQCFCTDTTGMCGSCSGTITTGTDLAGSGTQNLDTCYIKSTTMPAEPPVEPPASPSEPGQGGDYFWQDAGLGVCRINGEDGQGYGCWTWCDGQQACEDDDTCVAYWNWDANGEQYQCFCTDTTGMCGSCSGTITEGADLAGSGTQNLDTCYIKSATVPVEPPVEPPAESPVEPPAESPMDPGQGGDYVWQDAGLGVCRINGDDGQGYGCWTWCDGQTACEDDDTCVAYWNHGNDYQCFCTDTSGMCGSCSGTITTGTDLAGSGTQNLDTCWIKGELSIEPPVEPPTTTTATEPGRMLVRGDPKNGKFPAGSPDYYCQPRDDHLSDYATNHNWFKKRGQQYMIAIRCCDGKGNGWSPRTSSAFPMATDCYDGGYEYAEGATFEQAEAVCANRGDDYRLCTLEEAYEKKEAKGTGCRYNAVYHWVSNTCDVDDSAGHNAMANERGAEAGSLTVEEEEEEANGNGANNLSATIIGAAAGTALIVAVAAAAVFLKRRKADVHFEAEQRVADVSSSDIAVQVETDKVAADNVDIGDEQTVVTTEMPTMSVSAVGTEGKDVVVVEMVR